MKQGKYKITCQLPPQEKEIKPVENQFNLLLIKIILKSEKLRQIIKTLHTYFPWLFFPRLNFTPSFKLHFFLSNPGRPGRWGMEFWGQYVIGLLCSYFLLTHFSCSSMGSPQGAFPSGNIYLLQCGVPHGLQITLLLQSGPFSVLQWNLCFGTWREGPLPLAPSSMTLLFKGLIAMCLYFSSLLTLMAGILPFLKHVFTKVQLPYAMRLTASAVSCMGSLWSWLEWVGSGMGQSLASRQRGHLSSSPLPAHGHRHPLRPD